MTTSPQQAGAPNIATPDEVLETFTLVMRSDKLSDQLKAAEQLAKYHSLFSPKEEAAAPKSALAGEIDKAISQLLHRDEEVPSDGSGSP